MRRKIHTFAVPLALLELAPIYIYAYIHTCIHTYEYTYVYTHVCPCIHTYVRLQGEDVIKVWVVD